MQIAIDFAKKIYDLIAYIIAPPLCYACRLYMQQRAVLCFKCDQAIEIIAPKMFKINEKYILTVYTVSRYTEPLRPMLFAKYRSDEIVLEKLADIIWQKSVLSLVQFDYLIPIPLHWSRVVKRGFNQAELLANRFAKHSKIPVLRCLKRERKTEYQVRVVHGDRTTNIKRSMIANLEAKQITGKHIMLVDDSCTTGATALEAARALVPFKPASINMIVACRAL
ncbi:ComF family protein [Candidatus Dependentiae bacterium]|nr:ComF family protein [Candidatus Dependentiae bacterium]